MGPSKLTLDDNTGYNAMPTNGSESAAPETT